ncbi:hypothetical protein A9976_13325 [Delftia sp. UME58]|nr:hypothetical protein [Delftia sp. UME58]
MGYTLDIGVWMHRVKKLNIWILACKGFQCLADATQWLPKILPAMRGNQDQALFRIHGHANFQILCSGHQQSIDDGVACHSDTAVCHSIPEEILA